MKNKVVHFTVQSKMEEDFLKFFSPFFYFIAKEN